jgi:hypothetical protein
LIENVATWIENGGMLIENARTLIENVAMFKENGGMLIENTRTLIENTRTFKENAGTLIENAGMFQEQQAARCQSGRGREQSHPAAIALVKTYSPLCYPNSRLLGAIEHLTFSARNG